LFGRSAVRARPTHTQSGMSWKRSGGAGYYASGAPRYGNAGISGVPSLRHVKNSSKPERCDECYSLIPAKSGMLGWMATTVKKAYGCSTKYKSETKWYHVACCPEADPRAPSSTSAADIQRVKDVQGAPPPKESKKRSRQDSDGVATKAKKTEEFSEEVLALNDSELEKRAIVDVDACGIFSAPNIVYLKQHCASLSLKKSGTRREVLMRLITTMEARGITMKCDKSNYSSNPPYGYRGTLYRPDGEKL